MRGPADAERLAACSELADEIGQVAVEGILAGGRAQRGHALAGRLGPLAVEGLRPWVEEDEARGVRRLRVTVEQVRVETPPQLVDGQDIHPVVAHERRRIADAGKAPSRSSSWDATREFGATDVVSERGEAAVERVHELTDGLGVHSVLECVGLDQSIETAIAIARAGGAVGRVGVPQSETMLGSQTAFYKNVTIGGGPAPARAYIEELLPDIIEGRIEPGRVFDRSVGLDGVPDGYRAMADRESVKVMVRP